MDPLDLPWAAQGRLSSQDLEVPIQDLQGEHKVVGESS